MITSRQRPPVPAEALRLNEDIRALEEAIKLVWRVDEYNVADDRVTGRKLLRYVSGKLKMAEDYAKQKLRTQYLAPQKKIERRGKS